jgi:penicillin-binding protein 1C
MGVVLLPFVLLAGLAALTPIPSELLRSPSPSLRVLSAKGALLREVKASDGARARPLPLRDFSEHVRDAVLAAEDRRFYSHPGIDVLAIGRAVVSDVLHGRIVSGASTLTMQLARTLRPHPRSFSGKLSEAALALRIEAAFSKDRILEEYLNRIAYGPNVRGYAAASQVYLGAPPSSLSVAQAALLAGLPRGPSLYEVTRHPDRAKRRRDRVLRRMEEAGFISEAERARATDEPLSPNLEAPAFGAPHLVSALLAGKLADAQPGLAEAMAPPLSQITTTLDADLQRASELVVTTILRSLQEKHVTAAAVVVLDNATGDVLAYVGSPDFFDDEILGRNDGVLALRQPGSSLKPFVYAEAMRTLGFTGATLLPDIELKIPLPGGGEYAPRDFDTRLRGPVRLREALGSSLNIPAVYTLYQLGTQAVLDRLHAFGFRSLVEDAVHYGPALALGDGEVSLLELALAYSTLARGGLYRAARVVKAVAHGEDATVELPEAPVERVVPEQVSAMLTDILSDKTARMSAFGDQNVLELDFDVAAKTGTSKGFRDNVAVGYTRDVTVAVWAGNFDGSPMAGVSGVAGAGPIFRAVMEEAALRHTSTSQRLTLALDGPRLGLVHAKVCALSGAIATPLCPHTVNEWLPEEDREHSAPCSVHQTVRVDTRTGELAGPACPRSTTEERDVESWPPMYQDWAETAHRPLAPREVSAECPLEAHGSDTEASSVTPRVLYPFDGASFLVDPERSPDLQKLYIRVEPTGPGVQIRVDDVPLSRGGEWELAKGSHSIVASSANGTSEPVHIKVR